jgi:hypothetical protein
MEQDPFSWTVLTAMKLSAIDGRETKPDRAPFYYELSNGMRCHLASGAGPRTPQGFDGWAGVCRANDQSEASILWANSGFISKTGNRIYAGKSSRGFWQVAVGAEGASPEVVDVIRGYR